jgi:hypothetical protein
MQRQYGNRYVQTVMAETRGEAAEARIRLQRVSGSQLQRRVVCPPGVSEEDGTGCYEVNDDASAQTAADQKPTDQNYTPASQTPADDSNRPADQRQSDQTAEAEQTDDSTEPISMPPISGQGEPEDFRMEGGCDGLHLHGVTEGTFDGGKFNVTNEKATKGTGCNCPKGVPCIHVTGTLVTDYSVSVTISMPSVPGGLTDCETTKVQSFLQNVLLPHENDHKARLMTYNGRTQIPVDITDCGRDAVLSRVGAIQKAENTARKAAAKASSAAIDPFVRNVDCSDCQKDAGAPDAGPDSSSDAGPSPSDAGPDAGTS